MSRAMARDHARYMRGIDEAGEAIGSMVQDRPDLCDGCRKLAWLGPEGWNRWACLTCGRLNLRPAGVARPALKAP